MSWQLLEGRVLYRDLAWLYGPLSPALNAFAFRLFGASLATLAIFNLSIAALLAAVVYRFCANRADVLTATLGTSVLLVSFVFPHHSEDTASYNFVWPYAYAATHGTVLLVCGVAMASHALVSDRPGTWIGAGVLLGLTVLTKAEIALAAAATGGVAIFWRARDGRSRPLPRLIAFVASFLIPVAVGWCLLGTDAVVAPWTAVARVVAGEHTFNAHLIGTDDVRGNLWRLGMDTVLWSVVASGVVAADLFGAGLKPAHKRWLVIAVVAVVGACIVRDLPGVGRPLTTLIPVSVAVLIWVAKRRPGDRDRLGPLVLWGIAAWALLARMLLNVHLHHYGFYLAMPAAVFVVLLSVGVVPRLLAKQVVGGGRITRQVALATVGLLALYSAALSASSITHMTVPIGRDRDAMYGPSPVVSPTGMLAAALVERIASHVPPNATLAVLPDGTLMNFVTRRPNPTPFNHVMPPLLVAYGVDGVLESYAARSPDYVVLYEWSGDEYGVGNFGSSQWGEEIVTWVHRRYESISAVPSAGATLGFSIWRRRGASG